MRPSALSRKCAWPCPPHGVILPRECAVAAFSGRAHVSTSTLIDGCALRASTNTKLRIEEQLASTQIGKHSCRHAEACIVVGPCVAGAVLFRYMFRWGNRGRRTRPKRERGVVSQGKLARALHQKAVGASVAASTDAQAIKDEKIIKAKARRSKRMRTVRETRDAIRYYSGWAMVLLVYIVCLLVLLIIASQKIGPDSFRIFMLTFGTTVMMAWVIVEPLEICLIVFFPFILDNDYVANIRQYAKDLGLY
eukprot:725925-Pleurochrysis_carterae.AAC.1